MFDKRLMAELKKIPMFYMKVVLMSVGIVGLIMTQNYWITKVISHVLLSLEGLKGLFSTDGFKWASALVIGTDKSKAALAMDMSWIYKMLLLIASVVVLKGILSFWLEYYERKSAITIKGKLRTRLLEEWTQAGPVKMKLERSGFLSHLLQEGIEQVEPYFSEFIPQLLFVTVATPLMLAGVFMTDWISGLIMLFTAPLIPVFMMLIGKIADYVNKKQWKSLQQMNGHFLDVLRGMSTLRLFGWTKRQAEIVRNVNEAFRENTMSVLKVSFLSALVLELIATLSTALIAVSLGIRLLYGQMSFENAFFVLLMAPEYYQPIRQLGAKFHAAIGGKTAANSLYGYMQTTEIEKSAKEHETKELEHKEHEHKEQDVLIGQSAASIGLDHPMDIRFNKVSFAYDEQSPVLKDFELVLTPGTITALVGPSGSGKSTVVALLMKLIEPDKGHIDVQSFPLKHLKRDDWSKHYAYVPQNPKLFKGTLMENLSLGNETITEQEALEMLGEVGLSQVVSTWPLGLNTQLGEGHKLVSGGQKQLIALARALLKKAPLLILDEPTSALDPDTESKITAFLGKKQPNQSIVVIAHRQKTIQLADVICRLEKEGVR